MERSKGGWGRRTRIGWEWEFEMGRRQMGRGGMQEMKRGERGGRIEGGEGRGVEK